MIVYGYLSSVLYGVACLALSAILYKLGMPKPYSRKLVHILIGFEWLILYHFMGNSIHFLVVCLLFTALVGVSYFKNLMPMMSSEGDNAPGTVYYCVSMSAMATVSLFVGEAILPFGIAVFCTSLGDGMAGVVGQLIKRHNPKIYGNKSLFGTLANVCLCLGVCFFFDWYFEMSLGAVACVCIALFAAVLELVTGLGLDNLALPIGTFIYTLTFIWFDGCELYSLPIILTPLIIAVVLKKKILTPFALVGAIVLDCAVSAAFGNVGFLLLVVFLFGSVVIDKFKKRRLGDDGITKKEGARDIMQVVANGIMPLICSVLYLVSGNAVFAVMYVGALAEAFGDTAASGIGAYSSTTYDVFRLRKCQKGISGGMSLIGTLSSVVFIMLISLLSAALEFISFTDALLAALAAFLGTLIDSLLGSLAQVKYKCSVCGTLTERESHCECKTEKYSGIRFVNNDTVNLVSGVCAALIAMLIYINVY